MPLNDQDVVSTLLDPVLRKINFWVHSLHVRGEAYDQIAKLVNDGQILVVPGNDPKRAEYNSVSDTITTQRADSPPDLTNRGVIVHEATHALVDMEFVVTTWRVNEVCAYLAEGLYLLLSSPKPVPFNRAYQEKSIFPFLKKNQLVTKPGDGIRFSLDDIMPLVRELNKYPGYHRETTQMSKPDGISKKPSRTFDVPPEGATLMHTSGTTQIGYRSPVNVPFGFGRYDINEEAAAAVAAITEFINARREPGVKVYLTGYADGVGDASHNLTLSRRRAEAVSRALIKAGAVKPGDVNILGKGWANPAAPNRLPSGADNPDGRAKNRRVEVLIM